MFRVALLTLVFAAVSCRCNPPPFNPAETDFRVEEKALNFGRVLEGGKPTQSVHVDSTGVANQTLTLTITGPFTTMDSPVDLAGGSNLVIPVTFNAGSTPATGTLTVTGMGADGGIDVALSGIGVHPKTCMPSGPCHESNYDLASDSCVETVDLDGTMCTPTSMCLEMGQCRSGVCQGVARSCDDSNPCTTDGCSEQQGCVNTQITCPPSSDPCMVAICNPLSGCGPVPAPDYTRCGSFDCVKAHLCVSGGCQFIQPPDGLTCSPPTPCQDEGKCMQGVCKQPDAGVMAADFVLPIGGAPPTSRPMLLTFATQIFGEVCGLKLDAGAADSGIDAGTLGDGGSCAFFSYTNNGFERFTQRFDDPRERALLHIAPTGGATLDDGGLELRSLSDGTVLWRAEIPGSVVPRGIASDSNGAPWAVSVADDGGSTLWRLTDAGAVALASALPRAQLLAIDERGGAWLSSLSDGTLSWLPALDDGGLSAAPLWTVSTPNASTSTLAETAFEAFAGNRQLVAGDAGIVATLDWTDDAGQPLRVLERFSMMSSLRATAFYKLCPQPLTSCNPIDEQLWFRSVSLKDGTTLEEDRLAIAGAESTLVEAALFDVSGFPPGVLAVVQLQTDAGPAAWLRLGIEGSSDVACPFPPNTDIAAAAIGGGFVWVYAQRDAGPYGLEAYPLSGYSPAANGWPLPDGQSGQRRAR